MAKKKSMLQLGEELQTPDVPQSGMTHDENLRANSLALACRYYVETICKDGDLYREMVRDNKVLKPATYCGVLEVAFAFEVYIRGELKRDAAHILAENQLEEIVGSDREVSKPIPPEQL